MQAILPDIGSFREFPGEEGIAVDDFGEVFGSNDGVAFWAAGVFFPVSPGEVFVVDDVIDGVAFHH